MDIKLTDHIYAEIEYITLISIVFSFGLAVLIAIVSFPFQILIYSDYWTPDISRMLVSLALILLTIRIINFKVFTGHWFGYK